VSRYVICSFIFRLETRHVQDAVLAAEAGVDGILLSNHGGKARVSSVTSAID
jgi:isopentenyl diphosphate isomerase/L-lactate dehydrogenase-like FMN-dependent dehydrogenase